MSRDHWMILGGVLAGAALSVGGVVRRPAGASLPPQTAPPENAERGTLPPESVASVNGRLISRDDFRQALRLDVAAGLPPNDTTRKALLERMIDEELRVQHALKLGLHMVDTRVRMDLASAVSEAATASIEAEAFDEQKLRTSYETDKARFDALGPLRIRHVWIGVVAGNVGEAFNRARAATTMLKEGEKVETVREIAGTSEERPVPETFLSPDELSRLIDRSVLGEILAMRPGTVSDPIRVADGFHVVQLVERKPQEHPSFEASRLDVEAAQWSGRMKRALEENAAALRSAAEIKRTQEL